LPYQQITDTEICAAAESGEGVGRRVDDTAVDKGDISTTRFSDAVQSLRMQRAYLEALGQQVSGLLLIVNVRV